MVPTTVPFRAGTSLRDVLIGGAVIILILGATGLVLLMFEYFSSFPFQMNVIFSVVIIFSMCFMLQFFGLEIVEKAATLYWRLFGQEKKQQDGKNNPD
jgi:cobalamin biosynthesis protein CobD/CbiB